MIYQMTWKRNYDNFGRILDIDLVNNPDLALGARVSAKIICIGMLEGHFTGKKMSDFIGEGKVD